MRNDATARTTAERPLGQQEPGTAPARTRHDGVQHQWFAAAKGQTVAITCRHSRLAAPPPSVIAPGLLTLITAKQFKGKSTWLMAYFAAAREGWTWLDHLTRKDRILFVSEEGRQSLWKKREGFGDMSHVALHCADFPEFESEVRRTPRHPVHSS